jgi:hypothetical protein
MAKIRHSKQRKRIQWARERNLLPKSTCPNCGETFQQGNGHFATPSLGERGFYVCKTNPCPPKHSGGD